MYVLDEPTVGLHMADVEKLIRVLHRLVDAGNTVLVIEHNLDVIADAGGRIVAEGPPESVARVKSGSHTTEVLREFLSQRSRRGNPITM